MAHHHHQRQYPHQRRIRLNTRSEKTGVPRDAGLLPYIQSLSALGFIWAWRCILSTARDVAMFWV